MKKKWEKYVQMTYILFISWILVVFALKVF